jgi:hypothetical protein
VRRQRDASALSLAGESIHIVYEGSKCTAMCQMFMTLAGRVGYLAARFLHLPANVRNGIYLRAKHCDGSVTEWCADVSAMGPTTVPSALASMMYLLNASEPKCTYLDATFTDMALSKRALEWPSATQAVMRGSQGASIAELTKPAPSKRGGHNDPGPAWQASAWACALKQHAESTTMRASHASPLLTFSKSGLGTIMWREDSFVPSLRMSLKLF